MNAPRHLYLDSTGKRLVPADHPDAAELLAAEGTPINTKRLHHAGLTLDDVRTHVEETAPQDEDSATADAEVQEEGSGDAAVSGKASRRK